MKELKIFVVEDEAIILHNFSVQLAAMGHSVVGMATNGVAAVEGIKKLQPELVLMDINIPKKDGLSVIKEVCELNHIPTIIVTGNFSEHLIEECKFECVFGFLTKPVSSKQLCAAINVAMNRYERYSTLVKKSKESERALKERKIIEKAKGILMDDFGLKEADAMQALQRLSKQRSKKLSLVATEIIKQKLS